jgi:hypothetical protein
MVARRSSRAPIWAAIAAIAVVVAVIAIVIGVVASSGGDDDDSSSSATTARPATTAEPTTLVRTTAAPTTAAPATTTSADVNTTLLTGLPAADELLSGGKSERYLPDQQYYSTTPCKTGKGGPLEGSAHAAGYYATTAGIGAQIQLLEYKSTDNAAQRAQAATADFAPNCVTTWNEDRDITYTAQVAADRFQFSLQTKSGSVTATGWHRIVAVGKYVLGLQCWGSGPTTVATCEQAEATAIATVQAFAG